MFGPVVRAFGHARAYPGNTGVKPRRAGYFQVVRQVCPGTMRTYRSAHGVVHRTRILAGPTGIAAWHRGALPHRVRRGGGSVPGSAGRAGPAAGAAVPGP
ncbi:hypothetical protein CSX11_08930 [Mycobacterium goodii]|nr:hypothetical protein CSX11_08930 [Mycolicibacterium goodii]